MAPPKPAAQKTKTVVKRTLKPKVVKKATTSEATSAVIHTVGRRKRAIARLRLTRSGSGSIVVNNKKYTDYFPYWLWQETVVSPLPVVGLLGSVDISVRVGGGGLQAQAEAIRLAITRAFILHNPDWRPTLRKLGYLTRDPREKERKKPGLKRARRGPQWAKR